MWKPQSGLEACVWVGHVPYQALSQTLRPLSLWSSSRSPCLCHPSLVSGSHKQSSRAWRQDQSACLFTCALLLTMEAATGESCNVSGPQFPHLYYGDSNSCNFTEWLWAKFSTHKMLRIVIGTRKGLHQVRHHWSAMRINIRVARVQILQLPFAAMWCTARNLTSLPQFPHLPEGVVVVALWSCWEAYVSEYYKVLRTNSTCPPASTQKHCYITTQLLSNPFMPGWQCTQQSPAKEVNEVTCNTCHLFL